MAYGCELRSLEDWKANLKEICAKHIDADADAYVNFLWPIITDAMEAAEEGR